jgi:2-(1,2-epoxy-1,2-dihydrophenyl)acetyl-CoA isomerase
MAAGEGDAPGGSVRYEVADAIATITLDRPQALNALTVPLKRELLAALQTVARDRSVRAVVLSGAGRAFCAGQDLK